VAPGSNTNSQISLSLATGIYTIEATTYGQNLTGSFSLTVTGLGVAATDPGPGADPCAAELPAGPRVDGSWVASCQSQEAGRGYARYYTFTNTEARDVTITLTSDADPFLYLRSGHPNGGVVAQNDDHGDLENTAACASPAGLGNRDSCITIAGLSAGTYTIEVTTFHVDTAGSFILTVTGLSGAATGPGPGTDTCGETITADGTIPGAWAADCRSQERSGRYARYYTFTLPQQSAVTIDLESEVDTYLYLRQGAARSGEAKYDNDDVDREGGDYDSQISETLPAGPYTIEATTYAENLTGTFTLTIRGLSGTTTAPAPETDTCGETITANGATTGTWAGDCQSQQRSGRYARYYTFTLAQQSAVTIDLESEVDTYLYLREGEARSGEAKHENDDVDRQGGDYDSQISETLSAGTYTIEATTFNANEAGGFTLTVAGL